MTKARDLANVISGSGVLAGGVIPDLPASKITSGTIASARLSLSASDIPNLDTAKITSGTLADARLSSSSVTQHVDLTALSASNLTSGTVPSARLSLGASDIPALATSKITSGTFDDARLASSNITQHVDLSNISASNLTSGTIPNARYGTPTFNGSNLTNMSVASTAGVWTPSYNNFGGTVHNARYVKVGRICHISLYGQCTSNTATDSAAYVSGLPFTSWNAGNPVGGGDLNCRDIANGLGAWHVPPNNTIFYLRGASDSSITTVSYTSNYRGHDMAYISYFIAHGTYITAS